MTASREFSQLVEERFARFGAIRIKRMFGGAGVYCDERFFAIIDDDALYLKADESSKADFEREGLARFTFQPKDGPAMSMSYYAAPDSIFDDDDELVRWADIAISAAGRAKSKVAKRR